MDYSFFVAFFFVLLVKLSQFKKPPRIYFVIYSSLKYRYEYNNTCQSARSLKAHFLHRQNHQHIQCKTHAVQKPKLPQSLDFLVPSQQ